jgi:hypothetical protein
VVVNQLRINEWIAMHGWTNLPGEFLNMTFMSFWALFGWMAVPISGKFYIALELLSGVVAVGSLFWRREAWVNKRKLSTPGVLLASSALLTLSTFLWYNFDFYQPQGRYLFPALIPLGLAWTLGLRGCLRLENAPRVGITLALITVISGILWLVGTWSHKWRVLIPGLGTALFGGHRFLSEERVGEWLFVVTYLALAVLCAVSPFWFILPYFR